MDGGAWPFLVGGVICLVNSDNERDSPLLTGAYKRSRRRDFKVRSSRVARVLRVLMRDVFGRVR